MPHDDLHSAGYRVRSTGLIELVLMWIVVGTAFIGSIAIAVWTYLNS